MLHDLSRSTKSGRITKRRRIRQLLGIESLETRALMAVDFSLLIDAAQAPQSSSPAQMMQLGDTLVFAAETVGAGRQLWTSDGTFEGTQLISELDDIFGGPALHAATDELLFFTTFGSLWSSDGTEEGTTRLMEAFGPFDPTPSSNLQNSTEANGKFYFTASSFTFFPVFGWRDELWQSDGTREGTSRIRAFGVDSLPNTSYLTNVNGTLFFAAAHGVNGRGQGYLDR